MKKYKQINNLTIYNLTTGGWIVKAPDGRILETFAQRHSAEKWCRETLDFITRKKVILELYMEIWHCYEDGKGMAYSLFTTTELQEAEAICREKKYEIVQMIDLELQDFED